MLVEFKVGNFRSFRETQVLSLVASRDKSRPENLIRLKGFRLLKSAAVYGPNAGGKSNLIRALGFMEAFVRLSATEMNLGDSIGNAIPFRLDLASRDKPSTFEIAFILNDIQYRYGFSTTAERVHDESLTSFSSSGRPQVWFERKFSTVDKTYQWHFKEPLNRDGDLLRDKTRDNGLVLSRGADLNIKPLNDVFLWFRSKMWVYDLSQPPHFLMAKTAKQVKQDNPLAQRVLEMVKHADLGIKGILATEEPLRFEEMPEPLREPMKTFLTELGVISGTDTKVNLSVKAVHGVEGTDAEELFDIRDESSGTQRFFALAGRFLDVLDRGALLIVDELDCSMHPLLTRKLVEFFHNPQINTKGAQLVFATHDVTLMTPELFRRDQVWIVEKGQQGASELFSLHDFKTGKKPRSSEAFQRNYLWGRYGGVPRFGPVFEDLAKS